MIDSWATLLDRPEFCLDSACVREVLAGRSVLITGAGGSVGGALAEVVCGAGPRAAVLFDSHEASLVRLGRRLDPVYGLGCAHLVLGDVRDRRKLDQTIRRFRPEVIFHLAAYKHVPVAEENLEQVLGVNVVGALNVVEAAAENGVGAVAYPSTDKAVNPHGIYGSTKRVVERFLQARAETDHLPRLRVVRLVNVFGTQGSVAEVFTQAIEAGRPVPVTDVAMDRYWMTMREATHLLIAAAARPTFEGIHMIDVGRPVPLVETARRIFDQLRPNQTGPEINIMGVRPGERLHEELVYDDELTIATEIAGLVTVKLSDPTMSAAAWTAALRDLDTRLYEVDPPALRTWLRDAAIVPKVTGPSAPARSSDGVA